MGFKSAQPTRIIILQPRTRRGALRRGWEPRDISTDSQILWFFDITKNFLFPPVVRPGKRSPRYLWQSCVSRTPRRPRRTPRSPASDLTVWPVPLWRAGGKPDPLPPLIASDCHHKDVHALQPRPSLNIGRRLWPARHRGIIKLRDNRAGDLLSVTRGFSWHVKIKRGSESRFVWTDAEHPHVLDVTCCWQPRLIAKQIETTGTAGGGILQHSPHFWLKIKLLRWRKLIHLLFFFTSALFGTHSPVAERNYFISHLVRVSIIKWTVFSRKSRNHGVPK